MSDQYNYSASTLHELAECIWDADYLMRASPPQEIRTKRDPGLQPDTPAMVADVRRAWERSGLDSLERQIFTCRHYWRLPLESIGSLYDMEPGEVALMLDTTYEQLLNTINGR